MITDLVTAIQYLHHRNIVHRAIKSENLMVPLVPVSGGNGNHQRRRYRQMIKLADFGLAVEIRSNERLFTVCGTPTYVAPEILLEVGYGLPVDIWAAGVIAYILLSGYPPFANEDNDQDRLFDQIIAGAFEFTDSQWRDISPDARQLIRSMLCVDQRRRLTADQVLEHPWLV